MRTRAITHAASKRSNEKLPDLTALSISFAPPSAVCHSRRMARVPKIQIYKTRKGLYRWRLRGANGEIMCQGTSVKTFRTCWTQLQWSVRLITGNWPGLPKPSAPRSGVVVVTYDDLEIERWA